MRSVLGMIIIASGICLMFFIVYRYPDYIDTVLGYFFGAISTVIAFYFNTTQGSQEKNEMLRDSTPVNAPNTSSIKVETHIAENNEEKKP